MSTLQLLNIKKLKGERRILWCAACFPALGWSDPAQRACLPPSQLGRKKAWGLRDSPAEKSHLHVPPGQHLTDAPHFGQVTFDVQNLFFCRNWVQFCIPVGFCRCRLKTVQPTVRVSEFQSPSLDGVTHPRRALFSNWRSRLLWAPVQYRLLGSSANVGSYLFLGLWPQANEHSWVLISLGLKQR